jgi:hypothetical protein
LLENRCPICDERGEEEVDVVDGGVSRKKIASGRKKLFQNFRQLDKHVRVEHDLYYCDLCSGHLKVS